MGREVGEVKGDKLTGGLGDAVTPVRSPTREGGVGGEEGKGRRRRKESR